MVIGGTFFFLKLEDLATIYTFHEGQALDLNNS